VPGDRTSSGVGFIRALFTSDPRDSTKLALFEDAELE
jgi:hypothetical protein